MKIVYETNPYDDSFTQKSLGHLKKITRKVWGHCNSKMAAMLGPFSHSNLEIFKAVEHFSFENSQSIDQVSRIKILSGPYGQEGI